MKDWNGKPEGAGWHWLERRKDGTLRMAYWHPHGWTLFRV